MNIYELKEYIDFVIGVGIPASEISEDISNLSQMYLLEGIVRFKRLDKKKSKEMSSASTRNKIRKSMRRSTSRFKMNAGYKKWLKVKGDKYLKKTAKKRFESCNLEELNLLQNSFDIKDIEYVLNKDIIDKEGFFKEFPFSINEYGDSVLDKIKFLYSKHKELFIRKFIEKLSEAGVVLDQEVVEEDMDSSDVAVGDGVRYDNTGPWKRTKQRSFLIHYLPYVVSEVSHILQELISEDTMQEEDKASIKTVIYELNSWYEDSSITEEVEDFIEFITETFEEIETSDPSMTEAVRYLTSVSSDILLRRKYESLILNLLESGSYIPTLEQLNKIEKKIKECEV